MSSLGEVPGGIISSHAWAVSGDGSVIVGESQGNTAFIWDSINGLRDLTALLVNDFGFDPILHLSGFPITVSNDGRTIAANGVDPSGTGASMLVTFCELGDVNDDDVFDEADVPAFVSLLISPSGPSPHELCAADLSQDGILDGRDIEGFIQELLP